MSYQRRWCLVALGSSLALAALGSWGCCTVKWCDPAARILVVNATPSMIGYEQIAISKKKHQQIAWKLPSGSPYTNVAITLDGKPEPFVSCDEIADDVCHIECEHRVCLSGSINPAVNPPPQGIPYRYEFRSGAAASSDPGIRIDP